MKIFGIERLSMVDFGDRLATTLFTAGCNFRCPFCHNSSLATGEVGEQIAESEIFSYLEQRKNILAGVCISGGEPTLNPDLPEFVSRIKNLGYAVKLDTNGTNPDMLMRLVNGGLIDYVAMDVKSGKKGYPLLSGVEEPPMGNICRSVEYLLGGAVECEFRTTLVYELHDESDITEMRDWLAGAKRMFLQKFVSCEGCLVQGLHSVEKPRAEEYAEILREKIESVVLRGY